MLLARDLIGIEPTTSSLRTMWSTDSLTSRINDLPRFLHTKQGVKLERNGTCGAALFASEVSRIGSAPIDSFKTLYRGFSDLRPNSHRFEACGRTIGTGQRQSWSTSMLLS